MQKKRRGVRAFVALICIFMILGGGVGVLALGKAIALKKTYKGTPSPEIFDETKQYADIDTFVTLEKEPDKDFVILNLSDTHLSDYDYRLFTGFFALRDIKRLVEKTKPDLITLSGDIFCGASEYNSVKKLTETMNAIGIPWAPVFGNHDGEADNIDKDYLAEVMIGGGYNPKKGNYCLMRKGPSNFGDENRSNGRRVGNYVINIFEKGSKKLVHSLFMMDTGNSQLTDSQIKWYRQNVRTLQRFSKNVNSTLIVHIPLAQYYYAYMEGYDENTNEWNEPYKSQGAFGNCYEEICCAKKNYSSLAEMVLSKEYQEIREKYDSRFNTTEFEEYFFKNGIPEDTGMFDAIQEMNSTKTVICGHDHLNCFYAPFDGVNLAYSLKNGMGSGYKVGRNGGTLLTLSGDKANISYYYL